MTRVAALLLLVACSAPDDPSADMVPTAGLDGMQSAGGAGLGAKPLPDAGIADAARLQEAGVDATLEDAAQDAAPQDAAPPQDAALEDAATAQDAAADAADDAALQPPHDCLSGGRPAPLCPCQNTWVCVDGRCHAQCFLNTCSTDATCVDGVCNTCLSP